VAGGLFLVRGKRLFEKIPGELEAVSGYMVVKPQNPLSSLWCLLAGTGHTGKPCSVLRPRSKDIPMERAVAGLWRMMEPTDDQGQFVDRGYPF